MCGSQQLSGKRLDCGRQRDKRVWRGSLIGCMLDQPCQESALLLNRVQSGPVQTGKYAEGQCPKRQDGSNGPGSGDESDEDGGKNQQSQPNPGKEGPELSGGCRLLKRQFEDVMGGHHCCRVEADLGWIDMRVQTQVARRIAALIHEVKALLTGRWLLV